MYYQKFSLDITLKKKLLSISAANEGIAILSSTCSSTVNLVDNLLESCYFQNLPVIVFNPDKNWGSRHEIAIAASDYKVYSHSLPALDSVPDFICTDEILGSYNKQLWLFEMESIGEVVVRQIEEIFIKITSLTKNGSNCYPLVLFLNNFFNYCTPVSLAKLQEWLNYRENNIIPVLSFSSTGELPKEVKRIIYSCPTTLFYNFNSQLDQYNSFKLLPLEIIHQLKKEDWILSHKPNWKNEYLKFNDRELHFRLTRLFPT